jgi:hypothetical protein
MCDESILVPFLVVKCLDNNYYTYYEHGSSAIVVERFYYFETKIIFPSINMQLKVIKEIKHFWSF